MAVSTGRADAALARQQLKIERSLVTITERCRASEALAEKDRAERDRVIRDAIEADMPRARIKELTGLSEPRIGQIKRGQRI